MGSRKQGLDGASQALGTGRARGFLARAASRDQCWRGPSRCLDDILEGCPQRARL